MFDYSKSELRKMLDKELETLDRLKEQSSETIVEQRFFSLALEKALLIRKALKESEK